MSLAQTLKEVLVLHIWLMNKYIKKYISHVYIMQVAHAPLQDDWNYFIHLHDNKDWSIKSYL